jgi:hypothetical protein
MTPEDIASRHLRLYHVTAPAAVAGILRHGLLSTSALLTLFEVPAERRAAIEGCRRPGNVLLEHKVHGAAAISDNRPLSETKLAACLDDGLTPGDWLRLLNSRIFFWTSLGSVQTLLKARRYRALESEVLVFDTLSLARCHGARMALSPINSGATLHRPVRRGISTFAPLRAYDFDTWSRLRGQRDRIKEVTIDGGIADVERHLVDRHTTWAVPQDAAMASL